MRTAAMGLNSAAGILGFILGPVIAAAVAAIPEFHVWKATINETTSPGWASIVLSLVAVPFLITFTDVRPNKVRSHAALAPQEDEEMKIKNKSAAGVGEERAEDQETGTFDEWDWKKDALRRMKERAEQRRLLTEEVDPDDLLGLNSFGLVDTTLIPSSLSSPPRHGFDDDDLISLQDPFVFKPTEGQVSTRRILTNPIPSGGSVRSIDSIRQLQQPGVPVVAVLVCLYLQFVFYTAFTVFETIGSPYTIHYYDWHIKENGYLFAGIGAACILAIVILQGFSFIASDRTILLGSQVVMLAGFAILVNYPFKEGVGLVRFLIGVFTASMGFSAACALLIALFSKLLENQEMGMMMGFLSTAGSAARIVGPLAAGYIMNYLGASLVFLLTTALLLTALVLNIIFYRRLYTPSITDTSAINSTVSHRSSSSSSASAIKDPYGPHKKPLNKEQEAQVEAIAERNRQKEAKRLRREEHEKNKRATLTEPQYSDNTSAHTL
eukprot:TRINITY_DN155_c0_g1_i5.p1 TRINITY_DN155_c0_g1~~TRINITY_DN155_c0_g1_i5.p1  ORF type:complete len:495 (-),score=80.63 TRINITY_DN155_c0_g1_i5:89-1573(-)